MGFIANTVIKSEIFVILLVIAFAVYIMFLLNLFKKQ